MTMEIEDDVSTPEVMMSFYRRLYPFKSIFAWLNHQHPPTRLFTHREFAFTLQGDVYLRYNSFATADELRKQVIRLNPSRFEIGAIYNARPRDKKTLRAGALQPLQRELVFDIDMTDYDEIRTCCSGKGICKRCWGYIAVAVKILDACLRVQFGFRHILWVYSGRRGIHCWVSDAEAMNLTDEQRKAIMGWLEVIKGGQGMAKKVNVRGLHNRAALHPSLRVASQISRNEFPNLILNDQDCFSSTEQTNVILEIIRSIDKDAASRLEQRWSKSSRSSEEKWTDMRKEARDQKEELRRKKSDDGRTVVDDDEVPLLRVMEDIILQYTYPRLDAEVSKHRNHLLKAPFCVHPATGRVCVPVDPREADSFDPESVPTVGQLLRELGALGEAHSGEDGQQQQASSDWERTSLKKYVDMLDTHVKGLMDEVRRVKREQADSSADLTF